MRLIRRMSPLPLIFFCFMVLVAPARSEETGDLVKRQLFERFVYLTDMQASYDQMLDIMANQMKIVFQTQIQQVTQKAVSRTPTDKAAFATLMERFVRDSVTRIRDGMKKEVPFTELVNRVYYPIYERHFSESELRSIIEFYESPAGRKYTGATPALLKESVTRINELYLTKIQRLSTAIAAEEFERIAPELELLNNK